MKIKKALIVLAFLFIFLLAGCEFINNINPVTKITAYSTEGTIDINQTTEIIYNLTPSNATLDDINVNNGDETIISIEITDDKILVIGLSKGDAIVSLSAKSDKTIKARIIISVTDKEYVPQNPDEPISTTDEKVNLSIYAINDFHGMIFESESGVGISKLGQYLINQSNEESIIISAGDMFQGTAVSSMSRGKAVVEMMNHIKFDAMALGNHEFDWGIETILKYWDNDESNGEATFPLLCCNVKDKTTGKLASWATPYTVIERKGIKIGIIGVIGSDEESDILATYVRNYDFTDELTAIKKYTKELRNEKECDVVIVSAHCDTENYNDELASLTGEYKIDAMLNGHTHQQYYGEISRNGSAPLPYVQSGCYGKYIGVITLEVDTETKSVTDSSAAAINAFGYCKEENLDLNNIINNYQDYINIANEELGISGIEVYKDYFGPWASDAMKDFCNADVALINVGGVRSNGFPIHKDDLITYGSIFTMLPFENMIRTVELTGQDIINELFAYGDSYYFSNNCDIQNGRINGVDIDRNKYYVVATIDYVFEKDYLPFLSGNNRVDTNELLRDIIAQAVKENAKQNGTYNYFR